MARSSYIYLSWNHADELLGAFTVKHELVKAGKRALTGHKDYVVYRVIRTRDGTMAGTERHLVVDITDEILKEIR